MTVLLAAVVIVLL